MRLRIMRNARIRFQNKFENQNGGGGNDPGVESWRTNSLSPFSQEEVDMSGVIWHGSWLICMINIWVMYGTLERIYLNVEERAAKKLQIKSMSRVNSGCSFALTIFVSVK